MIDDSMDPKRIELFPLCLQSTVAAKVHASPLINN